MKTNDVISSVYFVNKGEFELIEITHNNYRK